MSNAATIAMQAALADAQRREQNATTDEATYSLKLAEARQQIARAQLDQQQIQQVIDNLEAGA